MAEGPISVKAQQYLINLVKHHDRKSQERTDLFQKRDATKAEIDACGDDEKQRKRELEADYGEIIIKIDALNKVIKGCKQEVGEVIRRSEQGELIDVRPVVDPANFLFMRGEESVEEEAV